jgi:hypothetical protein
MKASPRPDEVRQLVLRVFGEFSAKPVAPGDVQEVILIDAGRYRGRSYRHRRLMAMWLFELGLVQVYAGDGTMLRTINLLEDPVPHAKAA